MPELEPSVQSSAAVVPQLPDTASAAVEKIFIDFDPYETGVTPKFRARRNWSAPDRRLELSELPGVVVTIHVKTGQRVTAGTSLYVLDAMKMHNTFVARFGGVVKRIHMNPGDKIGKNQPVLEYE